MTNATQTTLPNTVFSVLKSAAGFYIGTFCPWKVPFHVKAKSIGELRHKQKKHCKRASGHNVLTLNFLTYSHQGAYP